MSIVLAGAWMMMMMMVVTEPSASVEPSEELPVVATDHPDATNGTFTVMPGVWQLEVDIDVSAPQRGNDSAMPPLAVPVTLRIGISDRVELRTFDGDLLPGLDARGRGGQGMALGAKVRLLDVIPGRRRPSLGVQPYASFPSFHPQSWLGIELGVIGLWTQPLTSWLAFDANASLEVGMPGAPVRALGSLFSVSMMVTASSCFTPYVELYTLVDWFASGARVLSMDAGFVMVVQRRLSFDLAARADVIAERRGYGLLGGISVILADGIRWRRRFRRRAHRRRGARPSAIRARRRNDGAARRRVSQ